MLTPQMHEMVTSGGSVYLEVKYVKKIVWIVGFLCFVIGVCAGISSGLFQ